ncbi:hypothetical protein BZA77DRAFT_290375 [Pyronema omphalodes]|nr:hypothetical protein BZA77DRAFT_290370 [Pyronema omphalodes]KAI5819676.1 hypothetical protein BZA77DRAFT_290375 [Pyronema omphalodes]
MFRSSKMKTNRLGNTVAPRPSWCLAARHSLIVRLRYKPKTVSIGLGPPRRTDPDLLGKYLCSKEMADLRDSILGWIPGCILDLCGPLGIFAAVALRQCLTTYDPIKEAVVQRLEEAYRCPRCTLCLKSGDESLNMATVWRYFESELGDHK